jgi:hypothetical protein
MSPPWGAGVAPQAILVRTLQKQHSGGVVSGYPCEHISSSCGCIWLLSVAMQAITLCKGTPPRAHFCRSACARHAPHQRGMRGCAPTPRMGAHALQKCISSVQRICACAHTLHVLQLADTPRAGCAQHATRAHTLQECVVGGYSCTHFLQKCTCAHTPLQRGYVGVPTPRRDVVHVLQKCISCVYRVCGV